MGRHSSAQGVITCSISALTSGARALVTKDIVIPYSLNISREKSFTDFEDFRITSKILSLKTLSCIAILYYLFVIREIFITEMLKAMNPRKIKPSK